MNSTNSNEKKISNYVVTKQILKFPYNGNFEIDDESFLSSIIILKVQKLRKHTTRIISYFQIFLTISNGVSPSIGLPIINNPSFNNQAIHRSINSEKNRIINIAPLLNDKEFKLVFEVDKIQLTDELIKQFKGLALRLNSGLITMDEAILSLRAGDGLGDFAAIIGFIILSFLVHILFYYFKFKIVK